MEQPKIRRVYLVLLPRSIVQEYHLLDDQLSCEINIISSLNDKAKKNRYYKYKIV